MLKKSRNYLEIFLVLIFLLSVFLLYDISIKKIKGRTQKQVENLLTTILNSNREALLQWMEYEENQIAEIVRNSLVIKETEKLLKLPRNKEILLETPVKDKLRDFFGPILAINNDKGIFIISPDYISLFSMRDANTGTINLMAKDRKDILDDVLINGNIRLVPPLISDVPLENEKGFMNDRHPTMFILAPVKKNGNIIAALSIRINLTNDFTRILEVGHIGQTGETYAFDKSGNLLSKSRYNKQLADLGLIEKESEAILSIRITDPGGNILEGYELPDSLSELPFTQMASSVLKGESGVNLKGYRNYIGVNVYGVWLWDQALGIGLATEIGKDEACEVSLFIRKVSTIALVIITLLSLVLMFISLRMRNKTERILKKANEELEIQVRERTKELSEANATKDKFFSLIAHDLKNPFNAILGLFELMLENPESFDEEKRIRLFEKIYNSGKQVYRLLENLLTWARAQTDGLRSNPEEFKLGGLINEITILQKQQLANKKIKLKVDVDSHLSVYADRNMMDTVFRNLISNAIKFTQSGGTITISATNKGEQIQIKVSDTGVGISAEKLENLFKADKKSSTPGTNNETGSGLGLILCKEFVELNEGKIYAESEQRKGSVFTVLLQASD